MKRGNLLLPALLLLAQMAIAQIGIGPRVGANFARANIEPNMGLEINDNTGLLAGILLDIPFGNRLGVQPEATYLRRGYLSRQTILGVETENELTLNYIDLGGMLKAKFGDKAVGGYIAAGAFYSIALNGELESRAGSLTVTTDIEFDDDYDRSDIHLALGGGLTFGLGENLGLLIDGRYLHGLNDIEQRDEELEINNRGFSVSAGLLIFLASDEENRK